MYCSCLLKDYSQNSDKQKLHLADTLLDLLSVLVEFWCQQHSKLNHNLVEKGLKDLAEHFAIISQGMNNIWELTSISQHKDIIAKLSCIVIAKFKVIFPTPANLNWRATIDINQPINFLM